MTNIVWKRPDGGVSITHLDPSCQHTPEQHGLVLKARGDVPADWEMVAEAVSVPQDRDFRNAWSWCSTRAIDVDMSKARKIHLDCIRVKRNAELERLDREQQKYRMNPNKVLEIEQEKVALRDLPKVLQPALDACSSVDELRAIQPI